MNSGKREKTITKKLKSDKNLSKSSKESKRACHKERFATPQPLKTNTIGNSLLSKRLLLSQMSPIFINFDRDKIENNKPRQNIQQRLWE